MASMSYCRWQNIRDDLGAAVEAFQDGKRLNPTEQTAMIKCCELFMELLGICHSPKDLKPLDNLLGDLYDLIENGVYDDD